MNNDSSTKLVITVIITAVIAGLGGYFIGLKVCDSSPAHSHVSTVSNDKQLALYTGMHKLWAEHMQYTYDTVDAFANNQKELPATLDRLLQNQKDIGNAIKPIYGEAAGNQLADLLTTHIKLAVPVLQAAKDGNNTALNKALSDWQQNAKDIADFLSSANPNNWPKSATEPMLKGHIDSTVVYASDLIKGDYAQALKDYGKAYDHMMMLADTLAQGAIAQHPEKF